MIDLESIDFSVTQLLWYRCRKSESVSDCSFVVRKFLSESGIHHCSAACMSSAAECVTLHVRVSLVNFCAVYIRSAVECVAFHYRLSGTKSVQLTASAFCLLIHSFEKAFSHRKCRSPGSSCKDSSGQSGV